MSHVFFARELEGVATFWRIFRTDGTALAFTSHDRDLWFDGLCHRAAPGMLPSSIRRTSGLTADSAEVEGALSHDAICAEDLAMGRYDGARVVMGAVDWETLENAIFYSGTIGSVTEEGNRFSADLRSVKSIFEVDPIPRTSPACRAEFCGPGCNLSPARFSIEVAVQDSDPGEARVDFGLDSSHADYREGLLRWIDGPLAGLSAEIVASDSAGLMLEPGFDASVPPGTRATLLQGCDHTLGTCGARFDNAINFQGEPMLPGNDLLSQYPSAS